MILCPIYDPLLEFNPKHEPAGTPIGGQFAQRADGTTSIQVVRDGEPIGLAAEARKAGSYEEFERDFILQIKHGLYFHITDAQGFLIEPTKGPRDRSTMSLDDLPEAGKLMITSDLDAWEEEYPNRKWVALIDMSEVPRDAYRQVNRGFGNEFWVDDPSKAKVLAVVPMKVARQLDEQHTKALPQSDEELRAFYDRVTHGQH